MFAVLSELMSDQSGLLHRNKLVVSRNFSDSTVLCWSSFCTSVIPNGISSQMRGILF